MNTIPPAASPQRRPPSSPGLRLFLRVAGGVLLGVGAVLLVVGLRSFAADASDVSAGLDDGGSGFGSILTVAAGGFAAVIGLGMLGAGFLGLQARYVAGETMPVVKQSAEYLTDGEGLLGVGRTAGPYCRACGARNDREARFCDGCGASLA